MKEMTGSMPAYIPAQEKVKREQREAVLQVSDPSYVPAEAASEWEHGDGEMKAWIEENFTKYLHQVWRCALAPHHAS
eukprot:COSAG01_NODE_543_length_15700_cov_50.208961_3_plen_77_part_00